jgi:starch synthase (maltosyl-transferring)
MKIDLVITELDVGGAEKALAALATGLHRRGHRVRVLSIGSPPPRERDRLVEQLEAAAIHVDFGGFDRTAQAVTAYRWLVNQLRREPADVCQTFLFHANCLGCWAAKRAGVPRVVGGLRVAEHKRWRLLCERVAVARMDRVVCVSSAVRDFAILTLGGPAERYTVIGNGVDVPRYRDAAPLDWTRLGWPRDAEVALFVGRLHRQKGLELITEHWPAIAAGHPRRKLLIVECAAAALAERRRAVDEGVTDAAVAQPLRRHAERGA